MGLQIGQLREGLVAAWRPTLVRLISRVRPDVLLKMRQLCELPLADLAPIWLDTQVDTRMLRQVRGVGERLGAFGALVRFGLTHVDLSV